MKASVWLLAAMAALGLPRCPAAGAGEPASAPLLAAWEKAALPPSPAGLTPKWEDLNAAGVMGTANIHWWEGSRFLVTCYGRTVDGATRPPVMTWYRCDPAAGRETSLYSVLLDPGRCEPKRRLVQAGDSLVLFPGTRAAPLDPHDVVYRRDSEAGWAALPFGALFAPLRRSLLLLAADPLQSAAPAVVDGVGRRVAGLRVLLEGTKPLTLIDGGIVRGQARTWGLLGPGSGRGAVANPSWPALERLFAYEIHGHDDQTDADVNAVELPVDPPSFARGIPEDCTYAHSYGYPSIAPDAGPVVVAWRRHAWRRLNPDEDLVVYQLWACSLAKGAGGPVTLDWWAQYRGAGREYTWDARHPRGIPGFWRHPASAARRVPFEVEPQAAISADGRWLVYTKRHTEVWARLDPETLFPAHEAPR